MLGVCKRDAAHTTTVCYDVVIAMKKLTEEKGGESQQELEVELLRKSHWKEPVGVCEVAFETFAVCDTGNKVVRIISNCSSPKHAKVRVLQHSSLRFEFAPRMVHAADTSFNGAREITVIISNTRPAAVLVGVLSLDNLEEMYLRFLTTITNPALLSNPMCVFIHSDAEAELFQFIVADAYRHRIQAVSRDTVAIVLDCWLIFMLNKNPLSTPKPWAVFRGLETRRSLRQVSRSPSCSPTSGPWLCHQRRAHDFDRTVTADFHADSRSSSFHADSRSSRLASNLPPARLDADSRSSFGDTKSPAPVPESQHRPALWIMSCGAHSDSSHLYTMYANVRPALWI